VRVDKFIAGKVVFVRVFFGAQIWKDGSPPPRGRNLKAVDLWSYLVDSAATRERSGTVTRNRRRQVAEVLRLVVSQFPQR